MAFAMPSLGKLAGAGAKTPRSQAEKLWIAAGVVGAALLVLIGYLGFIGPQRSDTDKVQTQITSAKSQNDALQARIAGLQKENANLASYQAALAKAKLALPTTSGASDFLRTLQSIGTATSTSVAAFTISAPAPVVAAVSTTAATDSAAAPAPSAVPAVASSYSMTITTQVTGSAGALNRFLQQLQSVQPRAVLITGLTEANASGSTIGGAPVASSGGYTLSLSMLAFVAPDAAAVAAATPTPTPTAGS